MLLLSAPVMKSIIIMQNRWICLGTTSGLLENVVHAQKE